LRAIALPFALLALFLSAPACGPAVHRVELGDFVLEYWQVAARRVSRTQWEYDFRARLTNQGAAPDEIQAWVTSRTDATAVLDGALRFGPVAPGATVPSADVFRVRHDRAVPFDPSALAWLEMDRYGGWKAIARPATGRFRVESVDGVWWLVTPAGHAYYCAGVTGFDPFGDFAPSLGTSPYHDHVLARHGSEAAWAEVAQDRFRAWNLNCVGGWSDTALFSDRIPYAVNGSFMSRAPAVPGWPAGITGRTPHDVFDPGFPAAAAAHAQQFAACAQNPWCIGVYSDNELAWGPGIFQIGTWVDAYMTLPAGAPGKRALQQFFEERYGGDVQVFNQVWGTQLARFDDLQTLGVLGMNIFLESPERQQARQAFLGRAASRYFQVVHDALRAVSPELLILGARFSPPFTSRRVIEASGPWVDVVSLNDYEFHPGILTLARDLDALGNLFLDGPFADLDTVYQITGKPQMITEYFYRLRREGVLTLPPGLPEVADETERAAAYTRYQDEMLARPYLVGTHWFEWSDQPVEGRFDGENQLIGLVDIEDDPHVPLVERMTQVNGATPLRRAALAGP
jgi:agarase